MADKDVEKDYNPKYTFKIGGSDPIWGQIEQMLNFYWNLNNVLKEEKYTMDPE